MKIKICLVFALSLCFENAAIATDTAPMVLAANDPAPLVSGQRVRVKKLTRDIAGVRESIVTTGPSQFQDPAVIEAKKKRMLQFRDALARYPQVNDPDVKAARTEYVALQEALTAEFNRAKEQYSKIGNAQQALATMEKNNGTYATPELLAIPFDEAAAKQWVKSAGDARTVAEHNQKQLELIAELAYLPKNRGTPQTGAPYDSDDVKRLQRISLGMQNDVQDNYKQMSDELTNLMKQMEADVFSRWQEDPKGDKKWIFLKDENVSQAADVIAKSRAIALSSVYLEQALNQKPEFALTTLDRLDQADKDFKQKSEIALSSSRLPEAASTDKKLLEIAKQILQIPKYEFGEIGKIVLTTDKIIDREKKTSEVQIDNAELSLGGDLKLTGTETTWTYKWQEFKFAAPLKAEDGRWHIWWITAKNFSSGGDRTPVGTWVSGKASEGNLILEKNF